MVEWSPLLPAFTVADTYEEGFGKTTLFSQMDTGPQKRRRRFTAAPKPLTIEKVFTGAELDIFIDFFETDLNGGATEFTFTHPRKGTTVTVAFTKEPDPAKRVGIDTYSVTLELEIQP